jgi:hypothetical protein
MKAMQQHERFSKGGAGNSYLIASRAAAKTYFESGSTRNTAHDEEFFHCFVNYLDEAIKKMKEQGGRASFDADELDNYGEEAMD